MRTHVLGRASADGNSDLPFQPSLVSSPHLTYTTQHHTCTTHQQFIAKAGDKASTAKDKALDRSCSSLLEKICQKYDNLAEVDKLAAVAKKVDTVKLVMQENVDIALQNCVKLESIERAAEELQQQAGVFKRNANELKNKM